MGFEIDELRNIDIKVTQNIDGVTDFNPDHHVPQLLIDAELTLRKANLKAKEAFQLDAQDLGKPILNLGNKLQLPDIFHDLEKVFISQQNIKKIPVKVIPRYQLQMLPYVIDGEDAFQGVLISIFDISEIKEQLKTQEKLNQKYENILDTISHDLNGPLANIQQLINEMENVVEKDEENIMLFDLLNLSVLRMKNSISDLVETNKKKGIAYKKPDKFYFPLLMDEVVLGLQDKIEKTGAKITMEFNVVEVLACKMNIRSILYNLLSNAIKFKSPKRRPEIKVITAISGDKVLLTVEDNGIGIKDEMKDKIFTKFGRCNERVEGTGMGLYIVKKMAEDMGGTVEVESTYRKGSTFKLYFKKGGS